MPFATPGVTLADAVRMVTANPSRLLGMSPAEGRESLREGVVANLTMFRRSEATGDVAIVRTVLGGHVVYEASVA